MSRACLLILIVAAACRLSPAALADPLQIAPQDGVLLLRSGGVLHGKISRSGDHYYVALQDGEIRVKTGEVDLFARDLDAAYLEKQHAGAGTAAEHLELANWCLKHHLVGYAARELMQARQADPRHPQIPLLERRLNLVLEPVQWPAFGPTAAPPAPAQEVEAAVARLPAGTIEMFTSSIQPLLLNRCSTAACHGISSTNGLRLERPQAGRPPTRRTTQRNLYSTLKAVNLSQPDESPLLQMPIGPHGSAKEAVLGKQERHAYEQLALWVKVVARGEQRSLPATVEQTSAPLLQTIGFNRAGTPNGHGQAQPGADAAPRVATWAELGGAAHPVHEAAPPAEPEGDADTQGPVQNPDDPFDPEIFNRRYSTAKRGLMIDD